MKTNYEISIIIALLYWLAAGQSYLLELPKILSIGFVCMAGLYVLITIIRFFLFNHQPK